MTSLRALLNWLTENWKVWFDGIGVVLLIALGGWLRRIWRNRSAAEPQSPVISRPTPSTETSAGRSLIGGNTTHKEVPPIVTIPIADPASLKKVVVRLRENGDIRSLSVLESGVRMEETPRGTYFYVLVPHLQHKRADPEVQRLRKTEWGHFECHRDREGRFFVLAFCASADALRISRSGGSSSMDVVLAPTLWDHADTLVIVPLERMVKCRSREIQVSNGKVIYVLDAVLA